jgi:hypothetical protein
MLITEKRNSTNENTTKIDQLVIQQPPKKSGDHALHFTLLLLEPGAMVKMGTLRDHFIG